MSDPIRVVSSVKLWANETLDATVRLFYASRGYNWDKETGKVTNNTGTLMGHHNSAEYKENRLHVAFTPVQPLEFISVTIHLDRQNARD